MLKEMPIYQNEPLIKTAYEVCRWHHERYDGRGYPDGLKGDDIPISSQVVALADVYDALTSKRIYKEAFSHETSIQMILDGECGAFNPLLLECLTDLSDRIKEELNDNVNMKSDYQYVNNITQEYFVAKEYTLLTELYSCWSMNVRNTASLQPCLRRSSSSILCLRQCLICLHGELINWAFLRP